MLWLHFTNEATEEKCQNIVVDQLRNHEYDGHSLHNNFNWFTPIKLEAPSVTMFDFVSYVIDEEN